MTAAAIVDAIDRVDGRPAWANHEWQDAIADHRRWLLSQGRSVKTSQSYSWAVRRLASSCQDSPWMVDRLTIERCIADPALEPNGRQNLISGVRSFYAWAHGLRLVDDDPAVDLRPSRKPACAPEDHPVLEEWKAFQRATASQPETIRIRTNFIRTLMRINGLADPLLIERRHVLTYLARDLAPWTQRTYHSSAEAWERWLRDFGYWPEGKVGLLHGIPRAKMPEPIARPVEDEVVRRLLVSPMRPRTRCYVLLALYGALRVHEIAKVRGDDFDLDSGWMRVTGKGRRAKTIPVHPELAALAKTMPQGFWFPSHTNPAEPVNPNAVSRAIRAALNRLGSPATAHQLRDTAATRLQRQHKDIRVTQAFLRHKSIQSTQKYTAVADDDLHRAVSAVTW